MTVLVCLHYLSLDFLEYPSLLGWADVWGLEEALLCSVLLIDIEVLLLLFVMLHVGSVECVAQHLVLIFRILDLLQEL